MVRVVGYGCVLCRGGGGGHVILGKPKKFSLRSSFGVCVCVDWRCGVCVILGKSGAGTLVSVWGVWGCIWEGCVMCMGYVLRWGVHDVSWVA